MIPKWPGTGGVRLLAEGGSGPVSLGRMSRHDRITDRCCSTVCHLRYVVCGYYWTPKMAKQSPKQHNKLRTKKASAEGQSPPQELEVGPLSGAVSTSFC